MLSFYPAIKFTSCHNIRKMFKLQMYLHSFFTPIKMRCGQTYCYHETAESDCAIHKQKLGPKSKAQCLSAI